MDLGALAALSAIAADPAATQTAREFLAQQKLQSDRMRAEQGMREAELQLQENQNRRSQEADYLRMSQQQKQFEAQEGRLKAGDEAEAKYREGSLGLQKDALTEEKRRNKALEDQAKATARETRMNNAIESYIALQKAHSKGTGLAPISYKEILDSMGSSAQMLFMGKDPKETPEKYQARLAQMQQGIAGGIQTLYTARGVQAAPEASGAYGTQLSSFLQGITGGIEDPGEKAQFAQEFMARVGAPDVSMRAGENPSPEVKKDFIEKMSIRMMSNIATGNVFSPDEQALVSYIWNSETDPTLKSQYIDAVVNTMATVMGEQKGWDQNQKLEWNSNFRSVLDNVIRNGDAANLSPYILEGAKEESVALPPTRLGKLGNVPQFRAIEHLGNVVGLGVQSAAKALTPKEKPKLKSRGASGGF